MERIYVSKEFRLMQTNCNFTMKFSSEVDLEKAYTAMEKAINEIGEDKFYKDYKALWLQDLRDCLTENSFAIESTLCSDAFAKYIPTMCKAVARALPEIAFNGSAVYDDLRCYYIDQFNFTYRNGTLQINEEFKDDDTISVESSEINIA